MMPYSRRYHTIRNIRLEESMLELFAKQRAFELKIGDEKQNEKSTQRAELCKTLGLDVQAIVSEDLNPADAYPECSKFDLGIWTNYLPTYYSKREGAWKNYHFDVIPHEVLEAIEIANGLPLFTDLEIWTAERNKYDDPIVVGVLGSHPERSRLSGNARFFLIARWGESLRPFEDISQEVLRTKFGNYGKPITPQATNALVERLQKVFTGNERATVNYDSKFFNRHCRTRRRIAKVGEQHILICPLCGDIITESR